MELCDIGNVFHHDSATLWCTSTLTFISDQHQYQHKMNTYFRICRHRDLHHCMGVFEESNWRKNNFFGGGLGGLVVRLHPTSPSPSPSPSGYVNGKHRNHIIIKQWERTNLVTSTKINLECTSGDDNSMQDTIPVCKLRSRQHNYLAVTTLLKMHAYLDNPDLSNQHNTLSHYMIMDERRLKRALGTTN